MQRRYLKTLLSQSENPDLGSYWLLVVFVCGPILLLLFAGDVGLAAFYLLVGGPTWLAPVIFARERQGRFVRDGSKAKTLVGSFADRFLKIMCGTRPM